MARGGRFARLRTKVRSHRLDAQLARGADPNSEPLLNIRAHELTSAETRKRIAKSLDQAMFRVPRSRVPAEAPVDGAAIKAAYEELDQLVKRLKDPDPVCPQGVARAQMLLSEGGSPLFAPSDGEELRVAVLQATRGLDTGPDLIV